MQTYKIPDQNLAALENKVRKLNRRAASLDIPPITLTDHGRDYANIMNAIAGKAAPVLTHKVTIEGELPRLDGHEVICRLVTKIDGTRRSSSSPDGREQVFVYPLPSQWWEREDAGLPPEYINPETARRCDHCHTVRRRKETFVLEKDGQLVVVGSTCMKDFTKSGDLFAAFAATLSEVLSLAKKSEQGHMIDWNLVKPVFELKKFVAICASLGPYISFANGLRSDVALTWPTCGKPSARRSDSPFPDMTHSHTNARAQSLYFSDMEVADKDLELAEDAIAWTRETLYAEQRGRDFTGSWQDGPGRGNIAAAAQFDYIDYDMTPFAAKISHVYLTRNGEHEEDVRPGPTASEWAGDVGDSIQTLVCIEEIRTTQSKFADENLYIVEMRDREGRVFVWFKSKTPPTGPGKDLIRKGEERPMEGKISRLNTFRDVKQTVMNRVKLGSST
jgi:hypothetical protein